jgi:hypothetical protein
MRNIPFRRFLKHVLKNAQKHPLNQRDVYINSVLIPLGLFANNFAEFSYTLMDYHKAKGRTFRRIGNAAKKNGMVINIFAVAHNVEHGLDVRKIGFFKPISIKTPQENILWKLWPGKPIERKIGVGK